MSVEFQEVTEGGEVIEIPDGWPGSPVLPT